MFVDVKPEGGMAQLDFSSQGDRSGGFVQPNLKPSAISRLTGPVTGDVAQFINGTDGRRSEAFPTPRSATCRCRCSFGCIPLGEVIEAVDDLGDTPGTGSEVCIRGEHPGRKLHQRPGAALRLRLEVVRPAGHGSRRRRSARSRARSRIWLDQAAIYARRSSPTPRPASTSSRRRSTAWSRRCISWST